MKIAVVGAHRKTKLLAPFGDSDWTIWSLSPRNERELPRQDAWFELHSSDIIENRSGAEYAPWLQSLPVVYMQEVSAKYPGSVAYPKDAMVQRFGAQFFTSTVAWMLALAISLKPTTIGVWGVECETASEYGDQRWGTQHFIEVARVLGINVIIPEGCGLLKPNSLYGYN